jgi:hypothetical protein
MIHDEAITLFIDVTGSGRTSIELTKADDFTVVVLHYALRVDWHRHLSTRVHKYSLRDHNQSLSVRMPLDLCRANFVHLCAISTAALTLQPRGTIPSPPHTSAPQAISHTGANRLASSPPTSLVVPTMHDTLAIFVDGTSPPTASPSGAPGVWRKPPALPSPHATTAQPTKNRDPTLRTPSVPVCGTTVAYCNSHGSNGICVPPPPSHPIAPRRRCIQRLHHNPPLD